MKIGLVVDNPYRDLPGIALLARELAVRGATCFLIPYNLLESELWVLSPDFVVLNFARAVNEAFIERIYSAGMGIGILDTEASVLIPVPSDSFTDFATAEHVRDKTAKTITILEIASARKQSVRDKVSVYLAWSKINGDFLVKQGLFTADQVRATGAPRSDMLTTFLPAGKEMASEYMQGYKKPTVLINISAPIANPAFATTEEEIDQTVKRFHFSRPFMENFALSQTVALREMAKLANDLARSFPEVMFIVRPHPFENPRVYQFVLDDLPNLLMRKEGTVDGWLANASCLIQLGSSTAVEAAVVGIPSFSAGWIPQYFDVPAADLASDKMNSIDELKQRLREVLQGCYQPSAEQKKNIELAIQMAHGQADGQAHIRCAEAILESINCAKPRISNLAEECRNQAYMSRLRGPKWRRWLQYGLSTMFGCNVHWSWSKLRDLAQQVLSWDSSQKKFTSERVEKMLRAFDRIKPLMDGKIVAESARRYYRFGYKEGRSVVVCKQ